MKRTTSSLIKKTVTAITLSSMLLGLIGCGSSETVSPGKPADVQTYDDSFLEEYISEQGTCKDDYGNDYEYSYHVPRLIGSTEGINKFNEEIDNQIGGLVRAEMGYINDGNLCWNKTINWESHWKDGLLSLVICKETTEGSIDYSVFHFDFPQDNSPDNPQLFKLIGINEESFLASARRAAVNEFDSSYYGMPNDEWYLEMYYQHYYSEDSIVDRRATTITAVNADKAMLVLDGDTCQYFAPIKSYSDNGPEFTYSPVTLGFSTPSSPKKVVHDSVVTARLENNRVFISFADTEEAAYDVYSYGSESFDYEEGGRNFDLPCDDIQLGAGNEYEVQGLFSDYKDIFLGVIGYTYTPYLFLVTQQDTLEYVDILGCAHCCVFCAMPCPGDFSNTTFKTQSDDFETILAIYDDGTEYDLSSVIASSVLAVPEGFWSGSIYENKTSGGTYSTVANWTFDNLAFDITLDVLDCTVKTHNGYLSALGMTNNGLVCEYSIDNGETLDIVGAFAYYKGFESAGDADYEMLHIVFLTGDPLYGDLGDMSELFWYP